MKESLRETVKTLRQEIDQLRQELRLQEARHQNEIEHQGEQHQTTLLAALDEIQRLKDELKETSTSLVAQRTPGDLKQELKDAYKENAQLVEFIQRVADATRTKFSTEAKRLLGQ